MQKKRTLIPNITVDPVDIKMVIKEYGEQLYAHKYDDVDEINHFPERHNLPKLIQEKK